MAITYQYLMHKEKSIHYIYNTIQNPDLHNSAKDYSCILLYRIVGFILPDHY